MYFYLFIVYLVFQLSYIHATQEQLRVEFNEFVNQEVIFNPLKSSSGIWTQSNQNQSMYNLRGEIVITNQNSNDETIQDIFITINNISSISLPTFVEGRSGLFVENNISSNQIVLYIPELHPFENSTWEYDINTTLVNPPLILKSEYNEPKILAGDTLNITDTVLNNLTQPSYVTSSCIYDITITQLTQPIAFTSEEFDILFNPLSLSGNDASNVMFSGDNQQKTWNVLGRECLNFEEEASISYTISTPNELPESNHYSILNSVLQYFTNNTISQIQVENIRAVSSSISGFDKNIIGPSVSSFSDFNVTWNVSSFFNSTSSISYQLEEVTLWVSQRNELDSLTNIDIIDNDTISNEPLRITYTPFEIINTSNSWQSASWLFNYTEIPSPIVWKQSNYTIYNDGVQLINRSITHSGDDIFIKELFIIVGYWLEVEKNVTSTGIGSYTISIQVRNKGNFPTPENAIVTVFDYVPSNFDITSGFEYSDVSGGWYSTASTTSTINGGPFNGTLVRWALTPTGNGGINSSLNSYNGEFNVNNTWSVDYTITGFGDYSFSDVFLVGLDPQKVDGAGTSQRVELSQQLNLSSSFERILALFAGVFVALAILV